MTSVSIVLGLAALLAMLSQMQGHMALAGLCIFFSAVADCADGQLARMRGTSSALGRMLDGVADFIVTIGVGGGGTCVVLRDHSHSVCEFAGFAGTIIITAVTGSFHTASYDHYKNVYLRLTHPKYGEAEDLDSAYARYGRGGDRPLWMRISWKIYLFYLRSQTNYIRTVDPHTSTQLSRLPAYDPASAAIYATYNGSLMRLWRYWFGFGSLTFGFAIATALDCLDVYVILRGTLLNCLYFGWMLPQQRLASERSFAELGLQRP